MSSSPLLGSHMSVSGGMHKAFERGALAGCTTMQVFTKNNNRWTGKPYSADDTAKFRSAAATSSISPVMAHAAYLINLCATNKGIRSRSRTAMIDELQRCEQLSIAGLILHPGAHGGSGESEGIRRIAESLNAVHEATPGVKTLTTLETTAGQGFAVGYRFEHLRQIIDSVEQQHRMAVCMDTCHVFVAGYDIATEEGWSKTMQEFDDIIGLQRLAAVHVNDSMKAFGSRVDRHEHIGKGQIGLTGFRMLMNDPSLIRVPKILETKKSEDLHEDVENMNLLRSLVT